MYNRKKIDKALRLRDEKEKEMAACGRQGRDALSAGAAEEVWKPLLEKARTLHLEILALEATLPF